MIIASTVLFFVLMSEVMLVAIFLQRRRRAKAPSREHEKLVAYWQLVYAVERILNLRQAGWPSPNDWVAVRRAAVVAQALFVSNKETSDVIDQVLFVVSDPSATLKELHGAHLLLLRQLLANDMRPAMLERRIARR